MEFKANDYQQNEIIKFIRQSTGKTQKEFAHELHKSTNWLRAIEQDINNIYFTDVLKIAKEFNIDIIIKNK